MSTALYACPVCSVLNPDEELSFKEHICEVSISPGRRSGRFFLVRPMRCNHHVDCHESDTTEREVAHHWNTWAEKEAHNQAELRKFNPQQTARWLYELSIGERPKKESQ